MCGSYVKAAPHGLYFSPLFCPIQHMMLQIWAVFVELVNTAIFMSCLKLPALPLFGALKVAERIAVGAATILKII